MIYHRGMSLNEQILSADIHCNFAIYFVNQHTQDTLERGHCGFRVYTVNEVQQRNRVIPKQ